MKLTIQTPSHSQLYSTWALRYDPVEITKHIKPKTSLKPLALSRSLNTSFNCNHEYQEEEKLKATNLDDKNPKNFNLPVVIRHSGTVSRCFWDGKELKLVSVDGSNAFSLWDFSLDYEDAMRKLGRVCGAAVRNFFLPREVGENYLEYVKWKFLHRVFSSALQVLATQAMFRAIGIGYSRSLPSAAALNWILKDGLGRLSRCIYTARLASAFDTNLKRVRFATSVLFSLSIGVELLTPVFPKYFLLLATIANIAKQISLACYLATSSAVHRSFAIADNVGEVSAKAQACYIRNGLLLDKSSWDNALEPCDSSDSLLREWFTLMEESKKSATIDLGLFIDKMSGLGWVCRHILLSSQEQARYSFVAD
ncbi:protein root UVB sensitive 4 [Sesamum angolense]|uniref:Protein root UVB sensitive 4 n=1 Tax=Sesamum angolense TaxID=2727404 RepID=A0AAE1XE24_9LAMI|nr:protein root UVB sensitive 4 [Sesamum angolense]